MNEGSKLCGNNQDTSSNLKTEHDHSLLNKAKEGAVSGIAGYAAKETAKAAASTAAVKAATVTAVVGGSVATAVGAAVAPVLAGVALPVAALWGLCKWTSKKKNDGE